MKNIDNNKATKYVNICFDNSNCSEKITKTLGKRKMTTTAGTGMAVVGGGLVAWQVYSMSANQNDAPTHEVKIPPKCFHFCWLIWHSIWHNIHLTHLTICGNWFPGWGLSPLLTLFGPYVYMYSCIVSIHVYVYICIVFILYVSKCHVMAMILSGCGRTSLLTQM